LIERGYDLLNCITVVPGAVGALRRESVLAVGGYTNDTLAEDTDLTWKLRRAGWRIVNDNSAMAYTEAPEDVQNLAKQRFRWAFGTLQCSGSRAALGQQKPSADSPCRVLVGIRSFSGDLALYGVSR